MKALHKLLNVILFVGFSFSLFSQYAPPGTVRLKPSETGVKHATFIDETEVTVQYWLDFLHWISVKYETESPEYKAMLPDSIICSQVYVGGFRYPAYRDLPMVGISYEQAIAYCKWRADRVNENLILMKKKKYNYTVSYSLPTKTDFKEAYKHGIIKYRFPVPPINELTVEKTLMIKGGWRLSFEPYQEPNAMTGFRCVAEITNNQISK